MVKALFSVPGVGNLVPSISQYRKTSTRLSRVVVSHALGGSSPEFKSLFEREQPPETAQQEPEVSERSFSSSLSFYRQINGGPKSLGDFSVGPYQVREEPELDVRSPDSALSASPSP